jgi:uncharacterized protein DUF5661/pyridoxamine 5'-phosphate oxidase-like protein
MATETKDRSLDRELRAEHGGGATPIRAGLLTDDVWRVIERHSFAILSYATPAHDPRSSGVMYRVMNRKILVAVGEESWKAKHIAESGRVAVTVPVRRGGVLSLTAPIPPATISFHGSATVRAAGSPDVARLLEGFGSTLPTGHRSSMCIIEIVPEGMFVTYAIGIPLRLMRDPDLARARVPVSRDRLVHSTSPVAPREAVTEAQAREVAVAIGLDLGASDFGVRTFRSGMEVELEHGRRDPETDVTNDDLVVTGKIAWAHLKELPDYYERLRSMEDT